MSLLASSVVLLGPLTVGAATTHAPRTVPNVIGLTRAEVFSAMRHADLYFQTRGPGSKNGKWASVVAESPRPGTRVAWHATVTFTTSGRAGHALRRVPRLIGLSRARVYAAMRAASLFFRTSGPGSSNGQWRYAVRQTPAAGTLVRWHSTIAIVTSVATPRAPKKKTTPVRHHPTTTTTRPRPTTTTSLPASTTTSSTSTTTTYPGETTTTSSSTTTTTTIHVTTTTVHTTTTTVKKPPVRYRVGLATWYSYFPGRCASSYLPYGTHITVRDLQNGHVVHCVVTDRQGSRTGRVVDLSETDFSHLTAPWRGVVRVKVSW